MVSDLWCNSRDAIVRGIVPLDSSKLGWKRVPHWWTKSGGVTVNEAAERIEV